MWVGHAVMLISVGTAVAQRRISDNRARFSAWALRGRLRARDASGRAEVSSALLDVDGESRQASHEIVATSAFDPERKFKTLR